MKWVSLVLLTMILSSCTSIGATSTRPSNPTASSPGNQPVPSADQTQRFTSLRAIQAVAPFPLLVPDPMTLPLGLTFQEAQLIPDTKRSSIALLYADKEATDQRREVTIQLDEVRRSQKSFGS